MKTLKEHINDLIVRMRTLFLYFALLTGDYVLMKREGFMAGLPIEEGVIIIWKGSASSSSLFCHHIILYL